MRTEAAPGAGAPELAGSGFREEVKELEEVRVPAYPLRINIPRTLNVRLHQLTQTHRLIDGEQPTGTETSAESHSSSRALRSSTNSRLNLTVHVHPSAPPLMIRDESGHYRWF